MLSQLQRLGLVGVGHEHNLACVLGQLLPRVGFDLTDKPVHVGFNDFDGFPKEPGRFANKQAAAAGHVKINRVNMEPPGAGRVLAARLDRGPQTRLLLLLDGPQLIAPGVVAGGEAVRRHGDFLSGELLGQLALGRLGPGLGLRQRVKALLLKVGGGAAKEKIVGVLDSLGPADDMNFFDQRGKDFFL